MSDEILTTVAHDIATITHVEAARQAFLMLWGLFVVAPILFGIDKLAGVLTSDWEGYLVITVDDSVSSERPSFDTCAPIVEIRLYSSRPRSEIGRAPSAIVSCCQP